MWYMQKSVQEQASVGKTSQKIPQDLDFTENNVEMKEIHAYE